MNPFLLQVREPSLAKWLQLLGFWAAWFSVQAGFVAVCCYFRDSFKDRFLFLVLISSYFSFQLLLEISTWMYSQ